MSIQERWAVVPTGGVLRRDQEYVLIKLYVDGTWVERSRYRNEQDANARRDFLNSEGFPDNPTGGER